MACAVTRELERRRSEIRGFPDAASLERLVRAVPAEIEDEQAADAKAEIR